MVKSFILSEGEFTKGKQLIYKFMPLERALNLLNTQTIWFANPETWADPYECRFINATYDGKRPFAWKGRVFCACFTDNATSEASWNAYSSNSYCIQFAFKRDALFELLNNHQNANPNNKVFLDKVEYMQTKQIERPLSAIPFDPRLSHSAKVSSIEFKVRMLLLKRIAFRYENEYRAIIVKPKATDESGIQVPIPDMSSLLRQITIGPKVEPDTYKMLKNVFVEKYGLSTIRIQQSQLYKNLPQKINIKSK